ncbi:hypothetical protein ACFE04_016841 [Oxalis oulophora]
MASKLCDSCKSASATLFCRADSAFLCVNCDTKIHAANKLASRHARVWVCEVCEQAPAHVTCKADAAALCVTCDRDIHSVNPLARRHERVAVIPFYHSVECKAPNNILDDGGGYFTDVNGDAEEAEAASWLLPADPTSKAGGVEEEEEEINNNNNNNNNNNKNKEQYVLSGCMDPYMDVGYGSNSSGADGVVPVVHGKSNMHGGGGVSFDLEYNINTPFHNHNNNSKSIAFGYPATNCLSNSASSSSLDVGVVPDDCETMIDVSNNIPYARDSSVTPQTAAANCVIPSAADREARVMRYREKRKNRRFEKTIRYASRKAYAETRPRIKGRFAKRTDIDQDTSSITTMTTGNGFGFGVVPSY